MTAKPKSKPGLFFAAAYLLIAMASLAWIFISGDSLAGVLAVMFIQPWSSVLVWLMDKFGFDSFLFNMTFMLGGALLNVWIIYKIIAWTFSKWRPN